MPFNELIEWQWKGYSRFHQSKKNLLIHIIFVPCFLLGFASFVFSLLSLDLIAVLMSVLLMAVSFGLQGLGHSKEANPAEPFTSFKNAMSRILLEQLYTFPKFVVTGNWYRAFVASKQGIGA
ncbi:hypothetical protein GCE9029_00827 [Grimontia celer]|uniref:Terminase n=1 Tax=Grimontia celer TaxID=1796497 RepID=A0A128EV27_9GAMM|nr:terminase [Grimontia celer]CZF78423.1 hypothetical protein GCE9029_00827 [Grimontia celer]